MTRAEFKKFAEEYAERIASVAWKDGYKDGYEAGEIAMKEKAAKICDAGFEECTSRPNCHSLDAELIRKLPLSGAEEAKK